MSQSLWSWKSSFCTRVVLAWAQGCASRYCSWLPFCCWPSRTTDHCSPYPYCSPFCRSAPCRSPFSWPPGWACPAQPVFPRRLFLLVLRWPSLLFSGLSPGLRCQPDSMGTRRPPQTQGAASHTVGIGWETHACLENEMTWWSGPVLYWLSGPPSCTAVWVLGYWWPAPGLSTVLPCSGTSLNKIQDLTTLFSLDLSEIAKGYKRI